MTYFESEFQIDNNLAETLSEILIELGANTVTQSKFEENKQSLKVTHSIDFKFPSFIQNIITKPIEKENQYKWLDHYDGFEIGKNFYIQPSNKKKNNSPLNKKVIYLDPKYAFGDGRHPTTTMCIELIENLLEKETIQSVLDIGTGTGILSILAEKLNVSTIDAFDIEEAAIKSAKKNALQNNCYRIRFFQADLNKYKVFKQYDLLIGNILTQLIESNIKKIKTLLAPQSHAILSGISLKWEKDIEILFNTNKLSIKEKKVDQNWLVYLLKNQ